MFIKSIEIRELYGRDYYLNLDRNLTILYGLNGSGKTTIINILFSILNGDLEQTFKYDYKYLRMTYKGNRDFQTLKVQYNEENDNYILFIDDRFIGELNKEPEFFNPRNNSRMIHKDDLSLSELKRTKSSVWRDETAPYFIYKKIIREAKNELVYVPLDRKVKGIEKKLRRPSSLNLNSSNSKNIENSLNLAENYYKEYQRYITQKENRIHESMRIQILVELSKPKKDWFYDSVLSKSEDFENLTEQLRDVINYELEENIKNVLEVYQENKASFTFEDSNFKVKDMERFLDYAYATAQLKNLHNVTEKLKDSKKAIDDLKQKSLKVISSVNLLLKETDKKIIFDKTEGQFYFTHLKKQEKISLNYLSSGEKQLIMFYIFSIIKFDKNESKILFIDEPELSLHIDWQSKLLSSIISEGENTQIIIATHSPDIIGNYIENTEEVKGVLQ